MALDKVSNFAKTKITGITSGATEVVLDDAINFLDPASGEYNCVIWEISNYGNPADDPNKEIVRATALSGNTLTITRAQESTSDVDHNTGGETYAMANVLTSKMITDIDNELSGKQATLGFTPENVVNKKTDLTDNSDTYYPTQKAVKTALDAKAPLISPSFTTPNIGAATGTSLDLEGTTLKMLSLKNTDANSYTRMLFDGTGVDFAQGVGNASAAITDLRNKFYIYDFTNSKTAFTIVPNTLAAKLYGTLETVGGATVGGTLAIGTNNLTMTGSIGATGARVTKGWFTDLEVTNLPTVNGGTLATALSLGTMASETATNYVAKSLFDANTILYATSDNTPAALTVAEQRVVGRLTGGAIDDIAIGIADNNILQVDDASVADNDYAKFTANGIEGVPYSTVLSDIGAMTNPMTTAGDVIYGGVDGLPIRLAKGDDGKVLTLVSGIPSWETPAASGGTVTSVSVTTANGISGSVATETTTPAITLTLVDITPRKVNNVYISGGTGGLNNSIGYGAGGLSHLGGYNSSIGDFSLKSLGSLSFRNIALGYKAGQYETGSDAFYVDSRDRTDTAGDKAGAILYGVMSNTPSSQTLKTNSAFTATYGMNIPTGQTYKINDVALAVGDITGAAPLASPTFTGTVTLPKTTKIQDTSADHTYNLAVSELTADRTVTLPLLTGDDTFLFKDFHKATSAEINTGTENDKYVTPDALAGSNAFTIPVQQYCVEYAKELAVADGVGYIVIPAECNGMNLISARADVITAGTTNASTFDIYNVTDSTSMLSSAISIASGAKSGTGTVDTAHDDVATGDVIRIDVDTLSTTKPKGLIVTLAFRLP